MNQHDTTGQVVMHHSDMGTKVAISRDMGAYPRTRAELNVRKLQVIETLDISITNPVVSEITGSRDGYGCGWGDTGKLYAVTESDIQSLRDAAAKKTAQITPVEESPEWRSARGLTLTEEMDREDSIY